MITKIHKGNGRKWPRREQEIPIVRTPRSLWLLALTIKINKSNKQMHQTDKMNDIEVSSG